jgi:hypothetical protein
MSVQDGVDLLVQVVDYLVKVRGPAGRPFRLRGKWFGGAPLRQSEMNDISTMIIIMESRLSHST